jgi:hypothetical protein
MAESQKKGVRFELRVKALLEGHGFQVEDVLWSIVGPGTQETPGSQMNRPRITHHAGLFESGLPMLSAPVLGASWEQKPLPGTADRCIGRPRDEDLSILRENRGSL